MLVTAVDGNSLTVARGAAGTLPIAHPNGSAVAFDQVVPGWLDPRLAPLTDRGGPAATHLPLPDSPLLDTGSEVGTEAVAATATTALSATYGLVTPLLERCQIMQRGSDGMVSY
jgi:hypothetical protein